MPVIEIESVWSIKINGVGAGSLVSSVLNYPDLATQIEQAFADWVAEKDQLIEQLQNG